MVSPNQLIALPLQEAIQYGPLSTPSSCSDNTLSQPTPLLIGLSQTSPSRIPEWSVWQNTGQHKAKQEEFNGGGASAFVSTAYDHPSKTSDDVLGGHNTADRPEHDDDDSGDEPSTASSTSSSGSDDASGSIMGKCHYYCSHDDNDDNNNHCHCNTTNNNATISSTPCAAPTTINHCSPSLVVPITSPNGCTQFTMSPLLQENHPTGISVSLMIHLVMTTVVPTRYNSHSTNPTVMAWYCHPLLVDSINTWSGSCQ